MAWQPHKLEVVGCDGDGHAVHESASAGAGREFCCQHFEGVAGRPVQQSAVVFRTRDNREDFGCDVGSRDEVGSFGLRQGSDECGEVFQAQSRHLPRKVVGVDASQLFGAEENGHAVAAGSGFIGVAEAHAAAVGQLHLQRVVVRSAFEVGSVSGQQAVGVDVEEVGFFRPLAFPPAVEVSGGHDVLRQAFVVELEQHIVFGQQSAVAQAAGECLGFFQRLGVVGGEGVFFVPVAVDECVADEEVTRGFPIDLAVVDARV